MQETTRVLIVDDSASMRRLIRLGIETDPRIEVIAEASSAREAREAVKVHEPDVMTLDIMMPEMDGLEFLRRLMRARPMPVLMLSSLTGKGSEEAVRALSLGAVDCLEKPRFGSAGKLYKQLAEMLVVAAKAQVRGGRRRLPTMPSIRKVQEWQDKMVVVGASTGGVEALEEMLSAFPRDCPPTLITQHMPAHFLVNFAARLNGCCAPEICLARDGAQLRQGLVMIAPGGETHMELSADGRRVELRKGPKMTGHRPSVDALFRSAVAQAPRVVSVLLTGMGSDGAQGMLALKKAGAFCIAQNEASSVVYGMPRVARDLGAVDISLPLSEIAPRVLKEIALNTEVGA
ncbi:protein-glutamate methylesterase/protein-glutamine glutaminase [Aliiroseovarius sp.]|uniref:protein-glutamate methylesterase/protein-glutamine glutaminase n=1 Tax=Aliiroseovarius sp. TaxID=1872442 RepID=UPI003BA854A3